MLFHTGRSARIAGAVTVCLLLLLALGVRSASAQTMTSDPASVSESVGKIDVFGTASDGHMWTRALRGGVWAAWQDLGRPAGVSFSNKPAAVSRADGLVDVFAVGSDSILYHKWLTGTTWSDWAPIWGQYVVGTPSVVSWASNREDVVVEGYDGRLWHGWWQPDANGGVWPALENLGGPSGGMTGNPSVITWGVNHLDIFVKSGGDGRIWHKYWILMPVGGYQWSGWNNEANATWQVDSNASPVANTWGNGYVDVWARGIGNNTWHIPFVASTVGWGNIENLGGFAVSNPALVTWGYGHNDVFVQNQGIVYHSWIDFTSGVYNYLPWANIGNGIAAGDPSVTTWGRGHEEVYTRTTWGTYERQPLSAVGWAGWVDMGAPDTIAPTSTVDGDLTDFDGGYVYDENYSFTAHADDVGSGVASVDAYATNSANVSTAFFHSTGSTGMTFVGANWPNGTYRIQVRVTDNAGNVTWSTPIVVTKITDLPSEKADETTSDGAPPDDGNGGPCGLGTDATCPSASDLTEMGPAISGGANRGWTLSAPSFPTVNGRTVFDDSSQYIGLSDQSGANLDTALNRLGPAVGYVRFMPEWDVEDGKNQTSGRLHDMYVNTRAFIDNAARHGAKVLISFDHTFSSPGANAHPWPNYIDYGNHISAFINDPNFASVRYFTAWNEPNHMGNPTSVTSNPRTNTLHATVAATYYRMASGLCHDRAVAGNACNVLLGDFSDDTGGPLFWRYLKDYTRTATARSTFTPIPKAWAVHLHREVQQDRWTDFFTFVDTFFDTFLSQTGTDNGLPVWVTEVGARSYQSRPKFDAAGAPLPPDQWPVDFNLRDAAHQQSDVMRRLFDILVPISLENTRVKRVFYYQWQGRADWDSGLIDMPPTATIGAGTINQNLIAPVNTANGADRPILGLMQNFLGLEGVNGSVQHWPDSLVGANTAAQSVTFDAATQAGTARQCQVDDDPWVPCTSPWRLPAGLAEGKHIVDVRTVVPLATGISASRAMDRSTTSSGLPGDPGGGGNGGFTVDATPPDTALSSPPSGTTSGSVTLSFRSQDSDTSSFECKLDSGAWAACASPDSLTGLATGAHTFQVRALDRAGNADASPASVSWSVDATAPDTTITTAPPATTTATSASIAFSGTDNLAVTSYECRLDSGSYAACTSPKSLTGLAPGAHTFSVRARDAAGNVDATPATAAWTVSAVLLGDQTVESQVDNNAAGQLEAWPYTATASGNAVTASIYLDSSSTAPNLVVGIYSDSSGRPGSLIATGTSTTPAAGAWNSVSIPSAPAIVSGTRYWIGFMSTGAGIKFRDHAAGGSCTGHALAAGLSAPPATWGTDVYSGTDCPASAYLVAGAAGPDTTAPDTGITSGPPASTNATSASIVFAGSDNIGVTGYECQLDAGTWAACTSPKAYTGLATGAHTFKVRARDAAGNVDATPATLTWTITTSTVQYLFGNQNVESYSDPIGGGDTEAWPYLASVGGTAGSVAVYDSSDSTASNLKVAIYSNVAGAPAALLASGSIATATHGAWNYVPLVSSTTITAGTSYWLAITSAMPFRVRDAQGGTCTAHGATLTGGVFGSSWSGENYLGSECPASVYVRTT